MPKNFLERAGLVRLGSLRSAAAARPAAQLSGR